MRTICKTMLLYYASSKRDAENLKSKLMRSKTNALMIVSSCSKCGCEKFKFVKFVYNQPADCVACKKKKKNAPLKQFLIETFL